MSQVCDPYPYGCSECYSLTLPYDVTLTVDAGLTPASTVYVLLTASNGNQYMVQTVVNGDGTITVDTGDYPKGMFNQWAGQYDVSVVTPDECYRETEGGAERTLEDGGRRLMEQPCGYEGVEMTIDGKKYYCIKLKITC